MLTPALCGHFPTLTRLLRGYRLAPLIRSAWSLWRSDVACSWHYAYGAGVVALYDSLAGEIIIPETLFIAFASGPNRLPKTQLR